MQGISGSVELRLFVDSAGQVVPESSTVQRTSGYAALDSAASPRRPSCVMRQAAAMAGRSP